MDDRIPISSRRDDEKTFSVAPKCVTCSARIQEEDTTSLPPHSASKNAELPSERRDCAPYKSGFPIPALQALPRSAHAKPRSPIPRTGPIQNSANLRKRSRQTSPNTSTPPNRSPNPPVQNEHVSADKDRAMSVAKHRPEDYGIRFIRAREPVEAGRAGGEEAAQTTHNGPTKWKWAPVNLNDPLGLRHRTIGDGARSAEPR